MTLLTYKVFVFYALLLTLGANLSVHAEEDAEDGVTVETVEELDVYSSPKVDPKKVHLAEHFDDVNAFNKKWVKSEAKKQGVDDDIAKYDGKWEINLPTRKIFNGDSGLVLLSEAKHAAISALLDKPFEFKDKPLVVQYEVTMQEGQVCGGAYLKLLSKGTNVKADLRKFHDQTAYTIMFGPDKCGNDNKLHFIFRHKNPVNGTIEEKHCKKPNQRLDDIYKDKEPHLYTLIVNPDNTFKILVDNKEANSGSLLEDFTPSVNPPEEISDPNDKKPDDWDERENIVDPTATKPEDWDETAPPQIPDPNAVKPDGWLDDEPDMVPDPDAKKPEDWDEDMDGEWEPALVDNPVCVAAPGCGQWRPPVIPNPEYKGIWRAPTIPNPNYRGKWAPRMIKNPHFFKDPQPFKMTPIHAIGFELWSMSPLLLFDNLIITDDVEVAQQWAEQTFLLKRAKLSKDSKTVWGRMLRAMGYRPGYWAMYIIYCLIPISIYVGFLVRLAMGKNDKEDSVVERAMKYAGDNPWVYVVLILGTFLLVGFVAYLCCGSSKEDLEAKAKKTDEVVEDDPHQSEGEEEKEEQNEEENTTDTTTGIYEPAPGCKAALETEPEADDAEGQEVPLLENDGSGDAHRKRKPRKE